MAVKKITDKLHLSTIGDDSRELALMHGLGLEIADFCWAQRLDVDAALNISLADAKMDGLKSFWFHAPFAELAPCAVDPRALALAEFRYRQAIEVAAQLGINRIVIHGGYIPYVYFPESYVEKSTSFWRGFLKDAPNDILIALENVMEPSPDMLVEIVRTVDDPRLGLCLDVGHANCSVSTLPPADWIKPMSPYLRHVHLHNNYGENDLHNCLGDGSIDLKAIITSVSELAPEASFTIENQRCAESIQWLIKNKFID